MIPTREAVAIALRALNLNFAKTCGNKSLQSFHVMDASLLKIKSGRPIFRKARLAIPNPVGTAPCFIVETRTKCTWLSLPGVPNEMEHILHELIIPYLQNRFRLG